MTNSQSLREWGVLAVVEAEGLEAAGGSLAGEREDRYSSDRPGRLHVSKPAVACLALQHFNDCLSSLRALQLQAQIKIQRAILNRTRNSLGSSTHSTRSTLHHFLAVSRSLSLSLSVCLSLFLSIYVIVIEALIVV